MHSTGSVVGGGSTELVHGRTGAGAVNADEGGMRRDEEGEGRDGGEETGGRDGGGMVVRRD